MTAISHAPIDRRNFLKAAALSTLAFSAGTATAGALLRRSSTTFFSWTEIAPGMWSFVDMNTGGNTLIARGSDAAILIDSKFAHFGPALRADALTLSERGQDAPVHLFNTHHHMDHTGGNMAFNEKDDRSWSHDKAARRILQSFDTYKESAASAPSALGQFESDRKEEMVQLAAEIAESASKMRPSAVIPDNKFRADEETVDLSGLSINLSHNGDGHTDNDMVIHFPVANVLHTGDLVFNGLHPFCDQSAGVTLTGWINSLNATYARCDASTVVVPGHGDIGDREVITSMRVYIESLLESVQADIDAGLSKEDAQAKTYDFMQGLGFEQIRPRAIGVAYDELTS